MESYICIANIIGRNGGLYIAIRIGQHVGYVGTIIGRHAAFSIVIIISQH
jgi:hypothetical protein